EAHRRVAVAFDLEIRRARHVLAARLAPLEHLHLVRRTVRVLGEQRVPVGGRRREGDEAVTHAGNVPARLVGCRVAGSTSFRTRTGTASGTRPSRPSGCGSSTCSTTSCPRSTRT